MIPLNSITEQNESRHKSDENTVEEADKGSTSHHVGGVHISTLHQRATLMEQAPRAVLSAMYCKQAEKTAPMLVKKMVELGDPIKPVSVMFVNHRLETSLRVFEDGSLLDLIGDQNQSLTRNPTMMHPLYTSQVPAGAWRNYCSLDDKGKPLSHPNDSNHGQAHRQAHLSAKSSIEVM